VRLEEAAERLADGELPPGARLLKQSPVRSVAQLGDAVIKVFHRRRKKAAREAETLRRADALAVPVPELLGAGPGWVATRFIAGRPACDSDLPLVLPLIEQMHERGMLHRDLHLGNLWIGARGPVVLDTQKARFVRHLPRWIRNWELGYFAFSLTGPLPRELEHVRSWRDRRARIHWRSRTKRCTVESSGFTRLEHAGWRGFMRRSASREELLALLEPDAKLDRLKDTPRSELVRSRGWILKRHRSTSQALASWRGGFGLEVRGIGVARVVAWLGPYVWMEDAGATLTDWIDGATREPTEQELLELATSMASLLARLHQAGIYHPDLKANNVCWQPGEEARLIDYGHVRFGRRVSERRRIKNLAQLNAALPDRIPNATRELALERYLAMLADSPQPSSNPTSIPERNTESKPTASLRATAAHEHARNATSADAKRFRARVIELSLRRRHRWPGC